VPLAKRNFTLPLRLEVPAIVNVLDISYAPCA
jgi:hypothetical protein